MLPYDTIFMNPETTLESMMRINKRETKLDYLQIQNKAELSRWLDNGLARLYQDVFSGPPYNESFTLDEIKSCFQDMLSKKGVIIVATDPKKNNQPVAFVVSVPLKDEFEIAAKVKDVVNPEKTSYFAEDGVDMNYRRQGLSARMKDMLLEANRAEGIPNMLLRTSNDNYAQISAVNKAGGKVLKDVFQSVARKRTDGSVTIEKSAFYLFDLQSSIPTKEVQKISPVLVLRDNGCDRAIVLDPLAAGDKKKTTQQIRAVYDGIKEVSYASDAMVQMSGTPVFNGGLYVCNDAQTENKPVKPRKKFWGLF